MDGDGGDSIVIGRTTTTAGRTAYMNGDHPGGDMALSGLYLIVVVHTPSLYSTCVYIKRLLSTCVCGLHDFRMKF